MRFRIAGLILLLLIVASVGVVLSNSQRRPGAEEGQQKVKAFGPVEGTSHTSMEMGPHMLMTALRQPQPGDRQRAESVAEQARAAIEKYKDYRAALRDGFKILSPEVRQRMYHFNNFAYAAEAERGFNATHPTSLLYEKTAEGYRLIGVMYTAPAEMTEDELDGRIPLSMVQWHQHVNVCLPSSNPLEGLFDGSSGFGLNGSITTANECERAGGHFFPKLFGWMVHLYPYERTPEEMWSVERQMTPGTMHMH